MSTEPPITSAQLIDYLSVKIELRIPSVLVEKIVRGIMDNFPEAAQGNELRCFSWKYDDMLFWFEDSENKRFDLDKAKLLAAFPLLYTDKWPKGCTAPPFSDQWAAWDDWLCQADATDFDAFVQLACLGEVMYG